MMLDSRHAHGGTDRPAEQDRCRAACRSRRSA